MLPLALASCVTSGLSPGGCNLEGLLGSWSKIIQGKASTLYLAPIVGTYSVLLSMWCFSREHSSCCRPAGKSGHLENTQHTRGRCTQSRWSDLEGLLTASWYPERKEERSVGWEREEGIPGEARATISYCSHLPLRALHIGT